MTCSLSSAIFIKYESLFAHKLFPCFRLQVSFWLVREILTAQTLKIRAEMMSHFIKIAKVHQRTAVYNIIFSMNQQEAIRKLTKSVASTSFCTYDGRNKCCNVTRLFTRAFLKSLFFGCLCNNYISHHAMQP